MRKRYIGDLAINMMGNVIKAYNRYDNPIV